MSENRALPDASSATGGSLWIAIGLVVFGIAGFAFLGLAGRELGPAASVPATVAWTAVNAVGIGLFLPLEQEISRLSATRWPLGGRAPSLAHVVRYLAIVGAVLAVVSAVGAAPLADLFFAGHRTMVPIVLASLLSLAIAYAVRGSLSGTGRYVPYGAALALDGLARIAWCTAVFLLPGGSAEAYTLSVVVGPLVASALMVPLVPRQWFRDSPTPAAHQPMSTLALVSLSSQVAANLGPLAISAQASPAQHAAAGNFVAAVTIARMPAFIFQAVQTVLLPTVSAIMAAGDAVRYRSAVGRLLAITAGLAVSGVLGVAWLGQWVLRLIYGREFEISQLDLVLLAVSGALFMLAQASAQVLLAHREDRLVLAGWVLGLAATLAALLLPGELTTRSALALCIGSGLSAAALGLTLVRVARHWITKKENTP